jgi:rhodanese-related sulfurtransferase
MKTRFLIILLISLIAPLLTAQIPDSLKYTVLGPEEFINEFNSGSKAVLIDVRAFKDYRKSRIKGAVSIEHPIPEDYFTRSDSIARDKSLFIYCYGGFRSKKAAVAFYDHGYRNIYSLEGGFMKWKSKKMPIDKKKIK